MATVGERKTVREEENSVVWVDVGRDIWKNEKERERSEE